LKLVAVTRHEKNLRELRCVVSRKPDVTLHHVHGGSMKQHRWHVGMGQKQNPFLQIPLNAHYHTGNMGIDTGVGVITWERTFGTQMEHLAWVNDQLDYDIWDQARFWEERNRPSMGTKRLAKVVEFSIAKENEIDSES
jgi:hypothetical protein